MALVWLTLLASGQPGAAAELTDLRIALDDDRIVASFRLASGFDKSVRERIESGLPTGFAYDFRLQRTRRSWFDKELARSTLQVVGLYNAVTREYLVNFKQDGRLIESRMIRDVSELEDAMTRLERVVLFDLTKRHKRSNVVVRARAELGSRTIFFLFPGKRATKWVESATVGQMRSVERQ